MPPRTITIIGSLNADLVLTTPRVPSAGETLTASSFTTHSGGKGANQAVACARLSRPQPSSSNSDSDIAIKMVGAVGSDEFGPKLLSALQQNGIDTSRVKTVQGQSTGVAVILVEEQSGENRILLSPGANYTLQPEDFMHLASLGVPKPDLIVLQLEIPLPTVVAIVKLAKETGVAVLLNPAPAVADLPDAVFDGLDHLIVNESEAMILSRREVRGVEDGELVDVDWDGVTSEFLRKGVKQVVVTLGAKGAHASRKIDQGFRIEAEKGIKVVDTTAAGDTFVGAYAVDVVRGMGTEWDMGAAVGRACKAAGRTVEKMGAQSSIPWINEV